MQSYRKRLLYIMKSAVFGFVFFLLSYYVIFQEVAEEDVFIATIGNLILIFGILIYERVETYIAIKISSRIKKKKPNMISRYLDSYLRDASLKSALYCLYIVILVCVALLAANPDFVPLHDMSEYFLSVRYGILVLLAVDKFMDQVFKDLKKHENI